MKRQPKPFSVEIKRSRRSATTPALSQPGALEMERADAEEVALAPQFTPHPLDLDLVVPEFLKAPNGARRPTSRENSDAAAKDRDKVFAPVGAPQSINADQSGNRTPPRVLQSLVQPETFDLAIDAKPARRTRTPKPKGDKPTSGKTRVGREPNIGAASGAANRERPASRKPAPAQIANEEPGAKSPMILIELQLSRPRIFLNNGRVDAAPLPPGQRWKRRLHPRLW